MNKMSGMIVFKSKVKQWDTNELEQRKENVNNRIRKYRNNAREKRMLAIINDELRNRL